MHQLESLRHGSTSIMISLLLITSLPASAQERRDPPRGRSAGQATPTPAAEPAQQPEAEDTSQLQAAEDTNPAVDSALLDLAAWRYRAARAKLEAEKASAGNATRFKTAMALTLAEEGKLGEAITSLEEIAAAAPKDPEPMYYLGEVAFWKADNSKAESSWSKSYERAAAYAEANPESPHGHYYLGTSQIRLRRFEQARQALEKARDKGAHDHLIDLGRGIASTYEGKWDDAKSSLGRVIEADPTFAYAYFFRGLVWNKTGKMDRMVADLEQFVALAPDAPDASQARALLSAAGG